MADDFFGPASDGAVTTRPTLTPQTPREGGSPTWFKPCSAEDAEDGTQISAEWANLLTGNMDAVRAAAGITAAAAAPGSDGVLLASILALIGNALPTLIIHRGTGAGTTDAITATVAPVVTAYVDGDIYEVAPLATSTTTTPTLSISGLTAKTIVHADGSALLAGELVAGAKMLFAYSSALDEIVLLGTPKAYVDAALAAKRALVGVQMITTSGTYTPTAGSSKMLAFLVGGGGGGAYIGSGGGGGATTIYSGPAAAAAVTIGAGGAAGTGSPYTGSAGGTTSLGALATAGGGGGGAGITPGAGGTAGTGGWTLPGGEAPEHGTAGGNGGGGLFGLGMGRGAEATGTGGNYVARVSTPGQWGGGGGGGDLDTYTYLGSAGGAGCILVLEFS